MRDELRILREHLPLVARDRPDWQPRLSRILDACDRLGATVSEPPTCGIHRDFYSAQVVVEQARIWLLDFDLYCRGDAALDIGNFIGHLTEQSLRTFGDPAALADREKAMEERFVELAGKAARTRVRAYATLTLVRHIYLSTLSPDRIPWTERLIQLCEQRLEANASTSRGDGGRPRRSRLARRRRVNRSASAVGASPSVSRRLIRPNTLSRNVDFPGGIRESQYGTG